MRATNLTLLTDLYELTMMQGYFKNPTNQTVIFDMFYRVNPCGGSFAITAGLEQMIEYIENLHFETEDIDYLRSLNIFEEDFLEYLSTFRFTGDIYAIPENNVVIVRGLNKLFNSVKFQIVFLKDSDEIQIYISTDDLEN